MIIDLGYTIQDIIIDGKRGLYKAFKDYHIQMCHFHQRKTINRYLTKKEHYTHPRVRAAYQSLITNLPYLFTYKNLKKLVIHNTTNSIYGGVFSPMKKLLKIHNGFTKSLKIKMVDNYLVNYKKK